MVGNTGFISTLGSSPTAPIDDATDSIHSAIIMSLNAASGENRAISGFGVAQGTTADNSVDYTHYVVDAGKVLRNGKLTTITGATLTTTGSPDTGTSNAVDWYGVLVVCDGEVSGESPNTLKWRYGTSSPSTGIYDTTNATVAAITAGDIPIAVIKYAANSVAHATNRHIQFLGYAQATREFSAINSGTERLRINKEGTLTHTPSSTAYTLTLPSTTGTLARTADNITGTAAGLSATLAVDSGGTGATTLTDGGILLGSGTGAITATSVLSNGQLLIGDGTTDPTLATLTAGSDVTITNGAGSISIASTDTQLDNAGVIGKVLTGLNVSSGGTVAASDTILAAFGRLENRVALNDAKVTNTDVNVSNANLLNALNALESSGGTGDETINIGTDSGDTINLRGNASVAGNLAVTGDLNITGDINSVSVTDLDVDDLTITVASGAADSAAADGAGLIIDGASASFTYSDSGTKFVANKSIEATSFIGNLTGNPTIGTKSGNVAYDLIFEDSGGLFQDNTTGNITYNPQANELTTVSLTATGQAKGATVAGTTRVHGGHNSLQGSYYSNTRQPIFEGYHTHYTEARLLADNADVEAGSSTDEEYYGTGAALVLETQKTQHKSGLIWTHDDDSTNTSDDFTWGIGRQFDTSGVGSPKLQIGYVADKTYDDAFLTNDAAFVLRSNNAALTIDTSKNVTLATGITLGDTALTTAGTVFYDGALKYFDGSGEQAIATTASSARTVTAGGNTLGASETLAFTAGTGITIAENAGAVTITNSVTDTNTNIDTTDLIAGLSPESGIHLTADHLAFTDATSSTTKKITLTQLMAAVTHPLIPTLPADKIDSGTFGAARIPTLAQSKVTNLATDLAAKVPTTRTIAGRALSADLVVRVNTSTGKLEVNDGSSTTTIQDTAGSPADVIFDNRKTEWGELQDASSNKPANSATVGATFGTNLYKTGTTNFTAEEIKNEEINLGISGTTLSLTNAGSSVTLVKGSVGLSDLDSLESGTGTKLAGIATGATKNTTFKQTSIPVATAAGDIWFDTDDNNKQYRATAANDDVIGSGEWIEVTVAKAALGLVKADVALGNVDNTADAAKPVSTAQQTQLDLRAPKASPTFTGTVAGVTKTHVGLSNVDNTSDATIQTAVLSAATKSDVGLSNVDNDSTSTIRGAITLAKSVSGDTKTLSLTNGNAATIALAFEDGATKNQVFRQSAAPTALSVGDIWVDTDDNKVYSASAVGTDDWELVTAAYTEAEKTKLGTVASNATANTGDVAKTGTINANEYARWSDATTLEARTTAEVLSDLGITSNEIIDWTGASAGTIHASNYTDTNTTYAAMGSGNSYAAGLVLAGSNTHGGLYLRKDGTWADPDTDTNTTYGISAVDGSNSDEEQLRITGSDASTDHVVFEAGTGLSIARSGDKITYTNTVTDTNTNEYADTLSFNTGDGTLTVGRSGSLADLTVDLDGRYVQTGSSGEANEYSFKTISISGQDDVVADTTTDTLTFAAGSNVTLTTTAASDTVTIAATDTNTTYSEATGSAEGLMSIAHHDKLDAIEASADVTDATNVTAAGALMDSELTGISHVKALNQSVISGATPTFTTTNFTDATDKRLMTDAQETKLDSVESSATADQTASEITGLLNDVASYTLGTAGSGIITIANDLTVTGTTTTAHVETTTVNHGVIFEGTTADGHDMTLISAVADSDKTVTIPNATFTIPQQDTTYSVGDGGLTQNNFTNTLKSKLDGIASSANNYTHTTNANLTGDVTSVGNATTIATDAVDIAMLSATGTASSSTFLRGDNTWVTPTDTNTQYTGGTNLTLSGTTFNVDDVFPLKSNNLSDLASASTARSNLGLGAAAVKGVATDGSGGVADGESDLVTGNAVYDYIAAQNFASSGASNFVVGDITGQTALTSGLASTDELVLSDAGALKRMDISVLQSYMQSALTFTTDTNTTYTAGTGLTLSSTEFSVTNNAIGADQLNVSGDGTTSQYLRSDGDGTFTWADPDTDTNTQNEYATSWVDSDANALLRLTESGAGSGTQDIKIVAGSNITLTPSGTDLTIAATDTNTDTTYTGGTNLTLSGTTFNVDDAFLKNDANDTTTGTITAGGFTTTGSITLAGHGVADIDITSEASDADDHLMTALAIKNRIEDYGYTTNTGTTTASNTQTFTGKSGSNNQWTNDAGYITSFTNTTYSAGTGLDLTSTTFSVDVSDFMANGSDNRILTATGADAMNAEANLTFDGSTLAVSGHIDATTKSFVIPHPTKENMTLRHGSLEGPEYGVYHRGRLIHDSTIALPGYWLSLVDDSTITVQLTANGSFQMLYVDKIENNIVHIDNAADGDIDCFYIIHGERKDIGKMEVEY